ncbi:DUF92 domain-containing protein [Alkalihalobacterium bogoriense]|uniref:DUF92 domain-containing protein n=1 Tax=Alkalihalobacterium bogoriense TaxID=246272 RepID=UPI00047B1B1E|nr:DUF92 domain-containing protein [Alkalihalobacterium bogoriense]
MLGLIVVVFLLSFTAFFFKKLSMSGSFMAFIVGTMIVYGLQLEGLVLLGIFFVSSTALGAFFQKKKQNDIVEKGDRRDGFQVIANGGVAAVCASMFGVTNEPLWVVAFVGSLAAANADTWASEIGTLSRKKPISILSFQRVERGTSGAISFLGTVASLCGAIAIAVPAVILFESLISWTSVYIFVLFVLAGWFGSTVDTLIGAFMQNVNECSVCQRKTEKRYHCQQKTIPVFGFRWITNDTVNLCCTITGAVVAVLFI